LNLGKTHEGRDMFCLKIGTPTGQTKNSLFIDAGLHAREWISPSTAIYTISQLVNGYSTTYKSLLDAIDIYVCPHVNPDGYEYSRTSDRLWRKTRTGPYPGGCYGVDPNRNWNFHWCGEGTSNNPCSEIYCGPSAFSEPNCRNLRQILEANNNTIKGYITLHSYGQDFLWPYGYALNSPAPDGNELNALGLQMATAIRNVHNTRYTVENSASLYPAAGASDDYSKYIGIKWVYTIELRPGANAPNGFVLAASQIIPTGEETLPALILLANRIKTGPN